jgi:hypothetical protein
LGYDAETLPYSSANGRYHSHPAQARSKSDVETCPFSQWLGPRNKMCGEASAFGESFLISVWDAIRQGLWW